MTGTVLPEAFSTWRLACNTNGYTHPQGDGLATQAAAGRLVQLLEPLAVPAAAAQRLRVRLAEDGYPCWMDAAALQQQALKPARHQPLLLSAAAIAQRMDLVLRYCQAAMARENRYLWGGTHGPHYDCSGLTQSAFASAGVWIPRDACQQEQFCQPVEWSRHNFSRLQPGDLIFFGTSQRCNHVGLHLGRGRYIHSSGREHGHGRIAVDQLDPGCDSPVANHYRSQLRGAGRVVRCHDGTTLPQP